MKAFSFLLPYRCHNWVLFIFLVWLICPPLYQINLYKSHFERSKTCASWDDIRLTILNILVTWLLHFLTFVFDQQHLKITEILHLCHIAAQIQWSNMNISRYWTWIEIGLKKDQDKGKGWRIKMGSIERIRIRIRIKTNNLRAVCVSVLGFFLKMWHGYDVCSN